MDSQSYSAAGEDEHVEPAVVYQEEGGVYILFYITFIFWGVYFINGSCSLCSLSQSRGKITCCPKKKKTQVDRLLYTIHVILLNNSCHMYSVCSSNQPHQWQHVQ